MKLTDWKELTWQGYLRAGGRMGIRNKTLVVYTVECASHVAREIVRTVNRPDVEVSWWR